MDEYATLLRWTKRGHSAELSRSPCRSSRGKQIPVYRDVSKGSNVFLFLRSLASALCHLSSVFRFFVLSLRPEVFYLNCFRHYLPLAGSEISSHPAPSAASALLHPFLTFEPILTSARFSPFRPFPIFSSPLYFSTLFHARWYYHLVTACPHPDSS